MTKAGRELLERALRLSEEERAQLAHDLLESIPHEDDDDLSPEWKG